MNLLLVYPYVPYPLNRGTYHRVFNLARELSRHHQVDLFCLAEEGAAEHAPVFREFARRIHFHPFRNAPWPRLFPTRLLNSVPATIQHWTQPAAGRALREFAGENRYDLVHFCDLVMWQYVAGLRPGPLRVMDRRRVDLLFPMGEVGNLRLGAQELCLRRVDLVELRRYQRRVA